MDDIDRIRRHFDEWGDREWERLEESPRSRVAFEIHRRFLVRYVSPQDRVLEIGAGPGRFTIALAEMGARVVVTDISNVQLDLNRYHVAEAGRESAVEDRYALDVRDTGRFADDEFDVVVAFGGPLSYVFEDAGAALAGLLRVGRTVVGSVMSTLGSWRFFLPGWARQAPEIGEDANELIVRTGDLRHEGRSEGHTGQMYRSSELFSLVADAGGELVAASASNFASLGDQDALAIVAANDEAWGRFLELEVTAAQEPGALDGGTHIVFAARRAS